MKSTLLHTFLIGCGLAAIAGSARADNDDVDPVSDAPDGLEAVRRGVQGPAGMLSARLTLAVNLSADRVGEPTSLTPDVFYGVSDRLQLGLVHDGPMRWQARPGLGLCLSGVEGGCPNAYDNVGVDLMYGLAFGTQLHLSAHGAFYVTSFDGSTTMLTLGAAGKLHLSDAVAVFFDPQIGLVLSDRDVTDDALYMPLELQFQLSAPNTLKVLSGVSGSLSAFGDTLEVPLGLGLVHNLSDNLGLGARFSFDNLLGAQPAGVDRADTRSLAVLLMIRN